MDVLLREEFIDDDGVAKFQDTVVETDRITIGSASDNTVQLLGVNVDPLHATLERKGKALLLTCARKARVMIGSVRRAKVLLEIGDSFELDGHRVRVTNPPDGFEAALQIRRADNLDLAAFEHAYKVSLKRTWLNKHAMAWIFVILITAVSFVVPLRSRLAQAPDAATTPDSARGPLTDAMWTSGPLAPAHRQAIGDRCKHCHRQLFTRVQDVVCRDCHEQVADHVGEDFDHDAWKTTRRCASCHRDHNDATPGIRIADDSLCKRCHAREHEELESVGIDRVSGFAQDTHPAFEASVLQPRAERVGNALSFSWIVEERPVEPRQFDRDRDKCRDIARVDGSEQSNLVFPHAPHLRATCMEQSGGPMACGDCHVMSADGEHFVGITMEAACINCHTLRVSEGFPERDFPHGLPTQVILTLEALFLRQLAEPSRAEWIDQQIPRPDERDENAICKEFSFDCAMDAAAAEIDRQFTAKSGCLYCHKIENYAATDVYARFQVHPVRLAVDYFPTMHFSHASHLTMGELKGDAACGVCHEAQDSQHSSDLLMPNIDVCVECHSDSAMRRTAQLNCVDCHPYHPRRGRSDELLAGEAK